MTRARDIANLVDANGDIVAGALDNVPASNDASALTTGTLPAARIGTGDAGKVLQIQTSALSSSSTTSTGSFSTGNSGLSVSITPQLSSSVLYVFIQMSFYNSYGTYNNNYFTIWRDGSAMSGDGSGYGQIQLNTGTGRNFGALGRVTPANNTNSTTFNLRFAMAGGNSLTLPTGNQLCVMEIAT